MMGLFVGNRPGVWLSGEGRQETVYDSDWFVDSVNGDDGNDGTAPNTAFATLAALDGNVQSDDKIGIAKGSHFREPLNAFATNIIVESYGTGERPIIDGSRIIPALSWTQDATYSNVYYADVTHEVETQPDATNENHSNTFHIAVWEDDTLLIGIFGEADIAANRALVNATPGTFTAHLQGSSDKDPRKGTGGTAYRYYVHLSDSGNPISNGAAMAYAEQQGVAALASGGTYRGLEFRRDANKDMVGMSSGTAFCREVSDCVFRDPGCHGCVIRPALLRNCYAYGRTDGRSKAVGGYGFNFYYGQSEGNYTPAISASGNYAEWFSVGIGSHGTANEYPVHESVTVRNNEMQYCGTAVAFAPTLDGSLLIEDTTALHCGSAVATAYGNPGTVVRRMTYLSSVDAGNVGINLADNALVEDSSFVFVVAGGVLAYNSKAQIDNNATYFVTLTLNRVSNKGGGQPANDRWAQVDLRGHDNVLGKISNSAATSTRVYHSIEVSNSYLSERQRTIAEMVAAGNVLTDCVSPWQLEAMTSNPVPSDDVSTTTGATYTATASSAGLTEITMSYSGFAVNNSVVIENWDGLGSDFYTYITAVIDVNTSNGRIQIANATPGAFSAKNIRPTWYNKQFVFGRPLRQYHANAVNNGPAYAIVDDSFSLSNVQESVLYRFLMPYVQAVATTATQASGGNSQIDAVNGIIDAAFDVNPGASLTVSAVCDHSADDLVWQGDPDTTGVAILDESSPIYALGMGRQS